MTTVIVNYSSGNNLTYILDSGSQSVCLSVSLCGTVFIRLGIFRQLGFSRRPQLRGILTRYAGGPSWIPGTEYFFLRVLYQRMERTFVKSLHSIQRVSMNRGGREDAQRPVLCVNAPKKDGGA
jgi:hypothetical protein